tara:strand:- start:422 stop:592 length:171 start_codon:yes stop_codon:yes gene_type:complete
MTPKEKAKELIMKMSFETHAYNAKSCAIIAVDELLNHCYEVMKPFWIEVKEEIDKL